MMYIKIDDNTVVALNGDEYRRAPSERWAAYEVWLAAGNIPQERFTQEQWESLNDLSRARLRFVQPE
jgi:hypothetical protein